MIIADTGFWLALADEKDAYHQMANQAFQTYDKLWFDRKGVPAQVQFIPNYSQNLFLGFWPPIA